MRRDHFFAIKKPCEEGCDRWPQWDLGSALQFVGRVMLALLVAEIVPMLLRLDRPIDRAFHLIASLLAIPLVQ